MPPRPPTLEMAINDPKPVKRLSPDVVLKMIPPNHAGTLSTFIQRLFGIAMIMPLFIRLFFSRFLDPLVNLALFTEQEWVSKMKELRRMGVAYIDYLQRIYEQIANTGGLKCCYILTMDLDKYVFIDGLSIRQQFRLFVASILYVGQGEDDEPSRKKRTMRAYEKDADPKKDDNVQKHHQVRLYKRLLMDGVHSAFVAKNVNSECACILEAMILNELNVLGLVENTATSPGASMNPYIDGNRWSSIVSGVLLNTFLEIRFARYGLHSQQLNDSLLNDQLL